MRAVLIGSYEQVVGFGLGGMETHLVESEEEALKLMDELLQDKDIALIIVKEDYIKAINTRVKAEKRGLYPLVMAIPGEKVPSQRDDPIKDMVRRATGIELQG